MLNYVEMIRAGLIRWFIAYSIWMKLEFSLIQFSVADNNQADD